MLTDKLKDYARSGVYPFHMPGHKRQPIGDLPFELDLTEIDGFDYLHDPQGCIRAVECQAQRLFEAERAFLLVNGATGGILAAVRAMTKPNDKVIVARNCHRSVYHAIELCGLQPVYYLPDPIDGTDIYGSVNPFMLDILLSEHRDAKLVIITSPTYEGVASEIEWIASVCHRSGARLLVDEAHGAHFPFSDAFPKPAIQSGADVSVVSLHKTLPAPTQTALLLTNDASMEPKLQQQLAVFETSSPSYLLMSGIESCLTYIENHSFKEYLLLLNNFYQKAKDLQKLRLLFDPDDDSRGNMLEYDIGKLVITTYGTNLTGKALAQLLRERYRIETEMSSAHYVIAMTSVCDTKEGFDRLFDALKEIDNRIQYSEKEICSAMMYEAPEKRFSPCDSWRFEAQNVSPEQAAGKAAMEYIYAYPPGIPYIVPGEAISQSMIAQIRALIKAGVDVTSTSKGLPHMIAVADW